MHKYIDAHVHITPASSLGRENQRFGTILQPYGFLKMKDGGFQTMPPYMHDSQFTSDALIATMDAYGVEKAVILQSLMAPQNAEVAEAVHKYPERLTGAMVVEPVDGWDDEIRRWSEAGLKVIKFEMRSYTDHNCYPDITYSDTRMMQMFELAEKLNLTVTIDPAPVNFPIYKPEELEYAVSSFPNLHFVLCHLGYPKPLGTPAYERRWKKMIEVTRHSNCWVDTSAMPDMFDEEGWPYPTALKILNYVKDIAGADYLLWGSDITGTLNRATYPQMQRMFEKDVSLSEEDMNKLFYLNAKAAYYLK